MTVPDGEDPLFGPVLAELSDQQRDEVLAAYAAVEHSPNPVHEAQMAALRNAPLRRHLELVLRLTGRTLVQVAPVRWTSGYRDEITDELVRSGWQPLPVIDRAVLVLVLIHSVAIPRSRGGLESDSWTSGHLTSMDDLFRYTQLPRTEVRLALQRLRAAGLVHLVSDRGKAGVKGAGYLPGPQLHRLTPAARGRLQQELILAAAPDSPLAAAIRARRTSTRPGRDG